ncbi:PTS sugar transporter subunit IIB [Dongshaea marina]|uniref:PTS sugar transporter subunit IIB n=1 Tax=Dongshaea marina TaxID=2047966 RepID=UPI000D3E4D8B|nr:PTS sugar transporter subunit IIB [Dongshaea marina]
MNKIFLCCAAGMSTSMVVDKMKTAAKEKNIEVDIIAVGLEEFDATLPDYDLCLLGPQVRYKHQDFATRAAAYNKQVKVINAMDYGMMNGEKILGDALKALID